MCKLFALFSFILYYFTLRFRVLESNRIEFTSSYEITDRDFVFLNFSNTHSRLFQFFSFILQCMKLAICNFDTTSIFSLSGFFSSFLSLQMTAEISTYTIFKYEKIVIFRPIFNFEPFPLSFKKQSKGLVYHSCEGFEEYSTHASSLAGVDAIRCLVLACWAFHLKYKVYCKGHSIRARNMFLVNSDEKSTPTKNSLLAERNYSSYSVQKDQMVTSSKRQVR